MSTEEFRVTGDGRRLIEAWVMHQSIADKLTRELDIAKINLQETSDNLAKWLLPSDAKPGEKIAVWYGDSLIQVEVGDQLSTVESFRPHTVTIRTRGRRGVR